MRTLIAILAFGFVGCKTVSQNGRSQYSLSSIAVSVPNKDAFPAGSPVEKINRVGVAVGTGTEKAECRAADGKLEYAPTKDGVGTVAIKVPQTCDYGIGVGIYIGEAMIYSGTLEIKSTELIGKDTYKANADLKVTAVGIRQGFAKEAKIEVASAKETDISIDTKVANAVYDVTKFVSPSAISTLSRYSRPDDLNIGSGFKGTFKVTKIADQLIPMVITCYAIAEAEFVTVDVPPQMLVESTRRITITVDKDLVESRFPHEANWQIPAEKYKRIAEASKKDPKLTQFNCFTEKDPAVPPVQ